MLNMKYLEELEEYMKSGNMEEDFKWSGEERRQEMLEFLEKLMDLGELADATATSVIFKGSQLGICLARPSRNRNSVNPDQSCRHGCLPVSILREQLHSPEVHSS